VLHRENISGETKINKLIYDEVKHSIATKDTAYIMTHVVGIDFNSLYPSAFSSEKHEFIPYTNNKMFMPGRVLEFLECKYNSTNLKYAKCLIEGKENKYSNDPTLFTVKLTGHIPKKYWNDFVNYPPIFRNINIKQNKETIGEYMYDYMKSHNMSVDNNVRKLTQLLECNEPIVISNYYLWFLIDTCNFVVDEIFELVTYTAHDKFNLFVNEFMNKRQQAMINGEHGRALYYKINLNGSYGYDGMNEEKFNKSKIKNKKETFVAQLSGSFMSTRRLSWDKFDNNGKQIEFGKYQVNYKPKSFGCNTCLQAAAFTLDNAKYWFLNYYYNVFSKCIDMEKVHITHGDTDSIYFAVAGNPNENIKQLFDYVIKDKKFYNEHMYKFLPNPEKQKSEDKNVRIADEKKLNGCCIEKTYTELIALGPKCYAGDEVCKIKGVSLNKNKYIIDDYRKVLNEQVIVTGIHTGFQLKNGNLSQLKMTKNGLTAAHTKMYCYPNHSCAPLVKGIKYE